MLPRSRNAIYENLRDYIIAVEGNHLLGCGALHFVWDRLAEIQKLPTAINEHGSSTNMINTITPIQKYGLMHGMGISHMQLKSGGTLDVKTGYHGYNKMVTDNYRRGQPNVMVARSVLHGTSFRRKNDYEGRAIRRVRKEALESMQEEINKETEKIMK